MATTISTGVATITILHEDGLYILEIGGDVINGVVLLTDPSFRVTRKSAFAVATAVAATISATVLSFAAAFAGLSWASEGVDPIGIGQTLGPAGVEARWTPATRTTACVTIQRD